MVELKGGIKSDILKIRRGCAKLPDDFYRPLSVYLMGRGVYLQGYNSRAFMPYSHGWQDDLVWQWWIEPMGDKIMFIRRYRHFFFIRWMIALRELVFPDKVKLIYEGR